MECQRQQGAGTCVLADRGRAVDNVQHLQCVRGQRPTVEGLMSIQHLGGCTLGILVAALVAEHAPWVLETRP